MNVTRNSGWWLGLGALVLGIASLGPMLPAQDNGQGQGQPARAVRLSYVDGQVTLAQSGQVLAEQAVANTPLFEGMQLTTSDNGKAEIQFEDGSVARISPDSSLTLAALRGVGASGEADLLVNNGLVYFELQGGSQIGRMSVQFGGASVTTSGFTVIRVAMDNPPCQLAVFSGNAHLEMGAGVAADLHGGESIALDGANPAGYQIAESIEPDSWDAWNSDRDQALTAEAAEQTGASTDVGANESPEWNDLDANGDWYDVPGQGYVWSPYEAANAGWDPYGYGNWMWTPGYGYLWVSGYPWGYLPFQCGAWNFYDDFGWGWSPGVGGCMPWWGFGYYRGPNIGRTPHGYQVVPRPILPRHPINPRPVAIIVVKRNGPDVHFTPPVRDRKTPVTIGGNTVQPLRTLPSRPVFNHTVVSGGTNRPQPGNRENQPGGGQITVTRPGYVIAHPTGPVPTNGQGWQNPSATDHNPAPQNRGFWGGRQGNQPSNGGSPSGNPPGGMNPGNESRPNSGTPGWNPPSGNNPGNNAQPNPGSSGGRPSGGTNPGNESRPSGGSHGWNPFGGGNSGGGSHPSGGPSGGSPSGGSNSGGGSHSGGSPSGGGGSHSGGSSGGGSGGGFHGGGGGGGNSGGGGGGGGSHSGGGGGGGSHSGGGGGGGRH